MAGKHGERWKAVNGWVGKEGEGKVQRERGVFVYTLQNRFPPCLSARHTVHTTFLSLQSLRLLATQCRGLLCI